MKKQLLLFLALMILMPAALAYTGGLDTVQIPEGKIDRVDTWLINTKVENWGYDKIFVALPAKWVLDGVEQGVTSYPVREYGLWTIYGEPNDMTPRQLNDWVYMYMGYQTKHSKTLVDETGYSRTGWYLLPNEGIIINVRVNRIDTAGGEIDPFKIEKNNPGIKIKRWQQRFKLEISAKGFITAPWTVKDAKLTEASPKVYSELGEKGAYRYYDDFNIEYSTQKWDVWFVFNNSLSQVLANELLAQTNTEFKSIQRTEIVKPVWKVDVFNPIMYGYEWEEGVEIAGIQLWRNELKDVPAWFEWF